MNWQKLNEITNSIIPPRISDFLNIELYSASYIYLNYWSFVHFLVGMVFYKFQPKKFKLWIALVIIFEVIEYYLAFSGNPTYVEKMVDTVWDIIIGIAGFKIAEVVKL